MDNQELLLLNIGAGRKHLTGYVNIDLEDGADIVCDVTKGLPFASNSVDGIYSEHFIEHLSQGDGHFFMRECRRVLVPGGVIRIATPDLDDLITEYFRAGPRSQEDPGRWRSPEWDKYGYEWISTASEAINTGFRDWGHKWMYNEEEVSRLATYCGFKNGVRVKRGESNHAHFVDVESRTGSSLVMEFTKAKREPCGGDPLVSLCIPAFKPKFFREALNSALAQTYKNIEIVISDDCRTDAILRIVEEYRAFPQIRYVRSPGEGGYDNWFNFLAHARGTYIKPFNDDDLLTPDCVEKLVRAAERSPDATLVTSVRRRISEIGGELPPTAAYIPIATEDVRLDGQYAAHMVLKQLCNYVGEPNCVIFRKSDAAQFGAQLFSYGGLPPIVGTPGDVVLWLNLLSQGDLIYLTDCLSFLRVHPEQEQKDPAFVKNGELGWNRILAHCSRLGMDKFNSVGLSVATVLTKDGLGGEPDFAHINSLIRNGEFNSAIDELAHAIQATSATEFNLALMAKLLFLAGRHDEEAQLIRDAAMRFPGSNILLSYRNIAI